MVAEATGIRIRPAEADDLPLALEWLAAAGLPVADLGPAHMARFLLAWQDDAPVGMIGLECFDAVGLLRSLVVDPAARRGGVGQALVDALLQRARAAGVRELWLLTIDADRYFQRLGFTVADRSAAPAAIRATPEFADLCPGDAVLMRLAL